MTSPADRIADLQAQLDVQRTATAIYQDALKQACINLTMVGRNDIAKSIADAALKRLRAFQPQSKGTDDDDDLAG